MCVRVHRDGLDELYRQRLRAPGSNPIASGCAARGGASPVPTALRTPARELCAARPWSGRSRSAHRSRWNRWWCCPQVGRVRGGGQQVRDRHSPLQGVDHQRPALNVGPRWYRQLFHAVLTVPAPIGDRELVCVLITVAIHLVISKTIFNWRNSCSQNTSEQQLYLQDAFFHYLGKLVV